jgi:toxin ParE1/3/4
MTYRLTRRARRDALAVRVYVTERNEPAADRFVDLLIRHFALLGNNPYAGLDRADLHSGYRSFPVGHHLIVYRVADPGVRIMRVSHGRRDIATLLEKADGGSLILFPHLD